MNRVCIVTPKIYPGSIVAHRGAETLISEGYEVDVICMGGIQENKEATINGVKVYRLPIMHRRGSQFSYLKEYTLFFVLAFLKLSWLSLKRRYDVIEVQNMPDFIVFTTLLSKLLGSKIILYLLDYTPEIFAIIFKKGDSHPVVKLLRFVEYISSHYADRIIVVCEPQRRRVITNNGLASNKVSVVLNVPDDKIFGREWPTIQVKNQEFRLITHGILLHRQGVQTLINAVPLLLKDIPELKVDIVGDGEYRSELEQLVKSLCISEYINITGAVPLEKIPAYIAQADIGIVAHLEDLMLPHKAFEYLALGKPVVASNHNHIREHFGQDLMLLFRPGDETDMAQRILELYHNLEKMKLLAMKGKAFYQDCNWSSERQNYIRVYANLIRKSAGNGSGN